MIFQSGIRTFAATNDRTIFHFQPEIVLDEIGRDLLDRVWPLAEPLLQLGLDAVSADNSTAKIREAVEAGRWQLWVIYRRDRPLPLLAAVAGYIRPTNNGPVAVIDALGGTDMDDWFQPALEAFEAAARAHGMTRIELEGRPGWRRKLRGYRTARIVLEKDLTCG